MRKFAKISAVLAAMVLALAFVGCKDDDDDDPSVVTAWYSAKDGATETVYFYDDSTFKLEATMNKVTMVGATGTYSGDTTKDGKIKMTIKKIFDEKTNGLVDCPASEAEGYATINGTVLTVLGDAEEDNAVFIKK
ncbi:MAG: hypothetical protein PUI64_10470 [Treponema succinifaciens]|uniref:hypothetical protein n=2 Tax=Treponema TaxID=157 RepID=UPI0023EFFA68|nr:hypothetical protein [Treponema succinifaciens]MDD6963301.1 hypothetical protein [Treponema succinifaciens]MDY5116180.1 hypothetical protein [Treponema succinifaciens]